MADSHKERDFRERDLRFFSQLSEEEQSYFRTSFTYLGLGKEVRFERDFKKLRHTAIWLSFVVCSFSLLTYALLSVSRAFIPIRHFALMAGIPLFLIGICFRIYDAWIEKHRWDEGYYYDE